MRTVTASVDIDASPESVWALMSDPDRYPEFSAATDRMIDVPSEPLGVGSVYREYGGLPPFKAESEWRVTVFEPSRRQVHVGDDGAMTSHLTIELGAMDPGTRLILTVAIRSRWFIAPVNALLWPTLMRKRAQLAVAETVGNIKRIVESAT